MTVKVSVVVPVYNPGDHIDALIESVLGQSLGTDEYEVIFADDASTDGTTERLDALAAEHAVLRVLHNSPNSGWPGKPRNLGIDAARGQYIYFVDSDDWIEPEALQRMYDYGVEHDSDIVWGKVVGEGRDAPREIFRRNNPDAQLGQHPLLSLLTVHKMFRTSFLRSEGIRFPEGRLRLEDHVFVMKAYFAATKISVLGDYTCYHWRRVEDALNISRGAGDPVEYFERVAEVVDIVEANTEPGDLRDRLVSHWWGGKSISWFEGRNTTTYEPEYVQLLFETVRTLALQRFPESLDRFLPVRRRIVAELIRAGDLDGLRTLMGWMSGIRAVSVAEPVSWDDQNVLRVRVTAEMQDAEGRPLVVRRVGDHELWQLPAELGVADPSPRALDLTGALGRSFVDGYVRNRKTHVSELVPVELQARPQFDEHGLTKMRVVTDVSIDPTQHMVLKHPATYFDVVARFHCAGWSLDSRPAVPDEAVTAGIPRTFETKIVTAYGTMDYGNLSLHRTKVPPPPKPPPPPPPPLARRMVRKARRLVRQARASARRATPPNAGSE